MPELTGIGAMPAALPEAGVLDGVIVLRWSAE
jgi:hypothetical protein